MTRTLTNVAALTILLFALDRIFVPIYPTVDLIRASMVGASALIVLAIVNQLRPSILDPLVGAIAIFLSAFISVLLIQAGILVSKSLVSGVVHIMILIAAFLGVDAIASRLRKK